VSAPGDPAVVLRDGHLNHSLRRAGSRLLPVAVCGDAAAPTSGRQPPEAQRPAPGAPSPFGSQVVGRPVKACAAGAGIVAARVRRWTLHGREHDRMGCRVEWRCAGAGVPFLCSPVLLQQHPRNGGRAAVNPFLCGAPAAGGDGRAADDGLPSERACHQQRHLQIRRDYGRAAMPAARVRSFRRPRAGLPPAVSRKPRFRQAVASAGLHGLVSVGPGFPAAGDEVRAPLGLPVSDQPKPPVRPILLGDGGHGNGGHQRATTELAWGKLLVLSPLPVSCVGAGQQFATRRGGDADRSGVVVAGLVAKACDTYEVLSTEERVFTHAIHDRPAPAPTWAVAAFRFDGKPAAPHRSPNGSVCATA